MLINSDKSGHPFLCLGIRGSLQLFNLKCYVSCVLVTFGLSYVEVPLYPLC